MAKVDLCFSGWVRGAHVDWATNKDGQKVNVSTLPANELTEKLNSGELFISLGEHLYDQNDDTEIELFDFTPNAEPIPVDAE